MAVIPKLPVLFGIDGNFYLHRVWHILQKRIDSVENVGRSLAYSFLSKVCVDALAVKADFLVITFDGDDVFRYDVFPDYKGERGDNSEIYSHIGAVRLLAEKAGMAWLNDPKLEGDDLLCALAHKYSKTHKVVIGTRDKDAYQYLQTNVRLYDSTFKIRGVPSPRYVSAADMEVITGMPPSLMIQYQALIGDGIDNIPAVVSPAKARKGLLKYGSIKNWCANDDEILALLQSKRKRLMRNKKLVTLLTDCLPEDFEPTKIKASKDQTFPKNYHNLVALQHPKSKGLF